MQDCPTCGALSKPRSLSLVFGYKHNPKFFRKKNLETKINFLVYGETPIIHFSYMKNAYHKDFIQFSVRMELHEIVWQEVSHIWKLYDKKFWSTRAYKDDVFTEESFSIFIRIPFSLFVLFIHAWEFGWYSSQNWAVYITRYTFHASIYTHLGYKSVMFHVDAIINTLHYEAKLCTG